MFNVLRYFEFAKWVDQLARWDGRVSRRNVSWRLGQCNRLVTNRFGFLGFCWGFKRNVQFLNNFIMFKFLEFNHAPWTAAEWTTRRGRGSLIASSSLPGVEECTGVIAAMSDLMLSLKLIYNLIYYFKYNYLFFKWFYQMRIFNWFTHSFRFTLLLLLSH